MLGLNAVRHNEGGHHMGGLVLSSIHETAYPRFKPELTQRELEDVYAPSVEDSKFIRRNAKTPAAKLYLALLLKTVLRLGYFPMLHEIPVPIVSFVSKKIGCVPSRRAISSKRR